MVKSNKLKKIIVILGPTASGKTNLAVNLAAKFNGEIVSADSRQVYRGMDVGTGKDLNEYKVKNIKSKVRNISYYLIDVVSPKTEFNLAKYQKLAFKAIHNILKRGKLPIIVGGTGLYLQAVVDNYQLSETKPDKKLRIELDNKTVNELFEYLNKLDPESAERLNQSDRQNSRRLVRKIEMSINNETGIIKGPQIYEALIIGLNPSKEILEKRIYKRLIDRLEKEEGMIDEVKRLYKEDVSWKRLMDFGLEYKYLSLYIQNKISYDKMIENLYIAIRQFAKRQMTWFRRWEKQGRKICWESNNLKIERRIKEFIK